MAYSIPQMPLRMGIWHFGSNIFGPPDLEVDCQLRAPNRTGTGEWLLSNHTDRLWAALVVAGTDIRDVSNSGGGDFVEIPIGTGRHYIVTLVDDVAKGFPNEYRIAFVRKTTLWPFPIP